MSDLEERLRQQLPLLAAQMVASHTTGAGQSVTHIWPRRRTGARRLIQLAGAVAVLAGAAGLAVALLGDPPPNVITTTPGPTMVPPDTVPTTPPPTTEPTPTTTQPPTTTQLEPEPAPTTTQPETESFADAPCSSPTVVDQTLEALVADCEALWSFYQNSDVETSLGSGESAWSHNNPLQNWRGVAVTEGRVLGLELLFLSPGSARLPPDFADLTALKVLSLCGLAGSIPAELGNLSDLGLIRFSNSPGCRNDLTGPVPPGLGDLINLEELRLDGNQLSGPIPPELGQLFNLRTLNLANNELSGSIPPELGDAFRLATLSLACNDLTGPIPAELGDLTSLQDLDLGYNNLSGAVPVELAALPDLVTLRLGGNPLLEPVPSGLADLDRDVEPCSNS